MSIEMKSAPLVEKELESLRERCESLKSKGVTPSMKVLLVGENKASLIYTRNKKKFCEKFGADCEIINLSEEILESEFLAKVKEISERNDVHGCFVQLPLPKHLQHIDCGALISPEKDVDGFHVHNIGELFKGDPKSNGLMPCTPQGVVNLIEYYGNDLSGKNVVIIGRSLIVGKPLSLLLLNKNATVTVCHSRTKDLPEHTKRADIIVSAVGRPRFLTSDYLSKDKNQILVDVGINHDSEGKLCGDMDYENIKDKCAAITPVPGGVGPLTILSLAQNLLQAAENSL
ncbi:MAG: bifunctional methylenetetrahydrofolate dehydrogenase/methenyltetrahydrofolate cyclohydrolase [Halobacteriovorax sp.]|nr:bifunctional methylenetetrahydrofolate dehydrogenase/methenyltetrahydrofolate cyclohydrolase [Halobacteriovorax sp.]|tara:strand:+ start:237961 stop:238821 length:861 start_codon:yes stop_codon:yes gene_type:complete